MLPVHVCYFPSTENQTPTHIDTNTKHRFLYITCVDLFAQSVFWERESSCVYTVACLYYFKKSTCMSADQVNPSLVERNEL